MPVKVDAIAEISSLVSQELAGMLWGDSCPRMNGLDRMPCGFDRNANRPQTRRISRQTGAEDGRGDVVGPASEDAARIKKDALPCLIKAKHLGARDASWYKIVAALRTWDSQEAIKAMRSEIENTALAVSAVPLGPGNFESGQAEVLAKPRELASEQLLAVAGARIEDDSQGEQGPQGGKVARGGRGLDSACLKGAKRFPNRGKVGVFEVDIRGGRIEQLHLEQGVL